MNLRKFGHKNMVVVTINGWELLYSYSTCIAFSDDAGRCFATETKYSVTTTKHLNIWADGRPYKKIAQKDFDKVIGGILPQGTLAIR